MKLSREALQDLFLAGKIAHLTLNQIERHIKPGVPISSIHDSIVKFITQTKGVRLAFPPNISIDECAAHDTAAPDPYERRVIPKNALVKIDIGASVNGMLSDSAMTISTGGKHLKLVKASISALNNAIDIIRPGLRVRRISAVIQDTIEGYGFKPVTNITGHEMEKGNLHAGLSIPSTESFAQRSKIKKGMILAIEPFSTRGSAGYVEGRGSPLIFSSDGRPKSDVGKVLVERYKKLPFSLRSATFFLRERSMEVEDLAKLLDEDNFHGYRPLIEKSGGLVSQAEHTVLVTSKGARVLT
ncbi:MAG: type II methionyl aminopeptidase [Candidatus Heimdallarchaeota archaeon]|nr:MAG: type II methionyl aminopeptidase [Candidatus Heimdallarchaeota archaeon]